MMFRSRFVWLFLACLILLTPGCFVGADTQSTLPKPSNTDISPPTQTHSTMEIVTDWSTDGYKNELFSFTEPDGWEFKDGSSSTGINAWNYYNLNLNILVEIRSKEKLPFITISSREMPVGSTLQKEFTDTYAGALPEIKEIETSQTTVDGRNSIEKRYDRPWGEPWYYFEDIWLEKYGVIYVISYQSHLNPTATDLDIFEKMLNGIHFY
jgi:hypothetical protein